MAERMAAPEFLYSKTQNSNSETDWLIDHGKEAENLTLDNFLQCVLEFLVVVTVENEADVT